MADDPKPARKLIRLPVVKPIDRIRVPGFPQAKSISERYTSPIGKQVTVIDHDDDTGEAYIRSYVERHAVTPDDPYYHAARHTVTVYCMSKLQFNVALTACHHYCKAPCRDHVDRLLAAGWSRDLSSPPPAETNRPSLTKRRGGDG